MRNVKETRRDHLRRLLQDYPSNRQFAETVKLSPAYLSQIMNRTREVGNQIARRIEREIGLPEGFLDTDTDADPHTDPQTEAADPAVDKMALLVKVLPADQIKLLMDYSRLSPRHREMVRETTAAYALFEQKQE